MPENPLAVSLAITTLVKSRIAPTTAPLMILTNRFSGCPRKPSIVGDKMTGMVEFPWKKTEVARHAMTKSKFPRKIKVFSSQTIPTDKIGSDVPASE